MSELARLDGEITYTPTGLLLGDLTFDRWAELGELLGRIQGALPWLLGDWLLAGEARFGERAYQAVSELGRAHDTLRGYAWVAERIPAVRRRTGLSWSAHREIAGLSPADQDAWLDRAEREQLGARDLRRLLRERRELEDGETTVVLSLRAPRAAVAAWRDRAGDRDLTTIVVELLNGWAA